MQDLLMQRRENRSPGLGAEALLPPWIRVDGEGARVLVRCRVQPRASRSEWAGIREGPDGARVKIRLMAPPVEGEANAALLEFFRKELGLASGCARLVRGHQSREKDVSIEGIETAVVVRILEEKVAGRKNGGA